MLTYMQEHTTVPSPALYYNFEHAQDLILKKDPYQIARDANVSFDEKNSHFLLKSLNQSITVSYPQCKAVFTETGKAPDLSWHMPILHYLAIADGTPLSYDFASIRDLKKHVAHPDLFERETGLRLIKFFDGKNINRIEKVCIALGGEIRESNADLFATLAFLPRFLLHIKLWMSDDEFPGTGKMLFDKCSLHYLDEMDIHILSPLVVSFLIKHYNMIDKCEQ